MSQVQILPFQSSDQDRLLARALYKSLGFVEVGTIIDRFRIDSQCIDDVMMTLHVSYKG